MKLAYKILFVHRLIEEIDVTSPYCWIDSDIGHVCWEWYSTDLKTCICILIHFDENGDCSEPYIVQTIFNYLPMSLNISSTSSFPPEVIKWIRENV